MRTKGDRNTTGEAVELLQRLYQGHEGRLDLPLMAYRSYEGYQAWTGDQATHYLRRGLSVVAETWEKERRGGKARLVSEEFALHTGRIGGTARLSTMGASPLVMQREGRWSSSAFMVYVRANMEDPRWVLEALSGEKDRGGRKSANPLRPPREHSLV